MKAEIIAVGTELLMGSTVNTNAAYIGMRLAELGIDLYRNTVVGDNKSRLVDVILEARTRCDIIITTGGLGPTEDDLTKDAVAEAFGLKMILDEASADEIKAFFVRISREMTQNNMRQAYFPEGAVIFPNPRGTAPGCVVNRDGCHVIVLPGPPREMKGMFEDSAVEYLSRFSGGKIVSRVLHFVGVGESLMEDGVKDLMAGQTNPTIAPYAKEGECELRLSAKAEDESAAMSLISPLEDEIRRRFGDDLYGTDGQTLESVVVDLLKLRDLTISFAESCTGGMITSRIVGVSGASSVLQGSLVAYSNEVKIRRLKVDPEILKNCGAVSFECAEAMALGCAEVFGTPVALSVTGIAGPDGGSDEKPVGTVFFGLCVNGKTIVEKRNFTGDRGLVRIRSSIFALDMIRRALLKK